MNPEYPGGSSLCRGSGGGLVPLCFSFIPAFLTGGRLGCGLVWPFLGASVLLVIAATLLVSGKGRRGAGCDAALLAAIAGLGLAAGGFRHGPRPVPLGLPEVVLRGRSVESELGWEARDISIARHGRWLPVSGGFLVAAQEMQPGGFVARGFIVSLDEPRMPGLADRNRGARWNLLRGRIEVRELWPFQSPGEGNAWRPRVRQFLGRRVGRALPPAVGSIIPMLIWGERATVDPEMERIFRGTGTMHLLAISGLHVSLIAVLLEFLLRLLLRNPTIRVLAVLAALGAYGALVGLLPSVVRSIVMAACLMIARAFGRAGGTGAAWWVSLLAVTILTPGEVARPGMQLSFAGTAALILCPRTPRLIAPLFNSMIAVAVTSGIVWGHFGETAPMAIVANLTGIPAFAPVLVSILWGLAWGDPKDWTLQALAWGPARLFSIAWIAPLAALLPAGERVIVRTGCGLLPGLASCTGILLALACLKTFRSRTLVPGLAVLGVLLLLVPPLLLPRACRRPGADLAATVLPIGQGDATLIRTASGNSYLVDTGPGGPDGSRGRRVLAPALRSFGVLRLRGVFLTHGDEDHVGGLSGLLLAGIGVDTLYLSRGDGYQLRLPRRRVPHLRTLAAPWSLHDGEVHLDLLWPRSQKQENLGNAGSLVLRVSAPGGSLLLPGDLGGEAEEERAASGEVTPADVLLAGHHGSGHSSGERWCACVRPRVVLISCGARNRFGHPAAAALRRLARASTVIRRTDRDGQLSLQWKDGVLRFRAGGCGPWVPVL